MRVMRMIYNMYNIIPLILILFSMAVIIVIVVRKFAVLANLDVDTIPAEREARVKEQIISNRLKRTYFKYFHRVGRIFTPIGQGTISGSRWIYNKLVEFKNSYDQEEGKEQGGESVVAKLKIDADELIKKELFDEAENKLIEIIGIDSKNVPAFKDLGKLYYDRKDYHEGRETLEHVIKLLEQDYDELKIAVNNEANEEDNAKLEEMKIQMSEIYFDLSLINKETESLEEAIKVINKALRLTPNNPRYLDIKLEISIMNKDKINALEAYQNLVEVNPDNTKLAEWKGQVEEL